MRTWAYGEALCELDSRYPLWGLYFFLLGGDGLIDATYRTTFRSYARIWTPRTPSKGRKGYALSPLFLPMSKSDTRSSPVLLVCV